MKKIGRIYGEAKINMREMIGNRENTTEPPTIRRQTKNIEDMREYLKEIYTRMQKQSKTNLLSIEENELVGNAFDEYGVKLREEGDFGSLGDVFVQLASFHQSIEALRMQMDTAMQTKVAAPFHDFVSTDVRGARNEKLKYDKARVSYDALHNKAKQMKKKGSIDKIVEVEREVEEYKLVYEEIALDTVNVQSDVCEKHAFQTLERLCEYITIYEDFFTQGLHLAKQISKDLPTYKNTIKELKEEFKLKKLQRGEDADEEPGSNLVFGLPLEDLVAREATSTGLPRIMENALYYIYNNSMKVEGVFRVSGSQKEVNQLKKLIGRGIIDFSQVLNDHNVTGVLKLFLRELPTPLLPFNLYAPLIKSVQDNGKDIEVCTQEMKVLLDTLPPAHKTAVRYLFGLLHQITAFSAQNLMTARNLAVVLAPNILYSREVSIEAVADSNSTIEFMIANSDRLFPGNFAEMMSAIPVPVPPEPSSRGGTLRGVPTSSAPGTPSARPSSPSASLYSTPGSRPVTAGVARMPVSSPAPSPVAPAVNTFSPIKPPAKEAAKQRPQAVRGSSMFQIGQVEREGGDEAYASSVLRKIPSEDHLMGSSGSEDSPRGTPYHAQVTTPSYLPGSNPSSSPSVNPRPPTASDPRRSAAISPGPKQLPPRPGSKPAGSPAPSLSSSAGLPPPPASYSSAPPPAFPTNLPPPIITHQTILGSGLPPRMTPPPVGYMQLPPPSLATPPLKNAAPPRQNEDLIQF